MGGPWGIVPRGLAGHNFFRDLLILRVEVKREASFLVRGRQRLLLLFVRGAEIQKIRGSLLAFSQESARSAVPLDQLDREVFCLWPLVFDGSPNFAFSLLLHSVLREHKVLARGGLHHFGSLCRLRLGLELLCSAALLAPLLLLLQLLEVMMGAVLLPTANLSALLVRLVAWA